MMTDSMKKEFVGGGNSMRWWLGGAKKK